MRYFRRFIWYVLKKLLIISCVMAILSLVFYYAMNAADIYIVINEGLKKRVNTILIDSDYKDLNKYFLSDYLKNDESLKLKLEGKSPYEWYKINSINHKVSVKWLWSWPWENKAIVEYTEEIPSINGKILPQYESIILSSGNKELVNPPKWKSGYYKAYLVHENGRWLIKSVTKKTDNGVKN